MELVIAIHKSSDKTTSCITFSKKAKKKIIIRSQETIILKLILSSRLLFYYIHSRPKAKCEIKFFA